MGATTIRLLIAKYGLQEGVVGSYLDSYHGWASRRGCDITASCVDCHTAHLVLPEEDPASSVAAANVVATCGQCHEGADSAFAASYNHTTASMAGNPVNRIIRDIYLWAIALIIGGMILHNLVIMNFFMIKRRKEQAGTGATVFRFTMNEVVPAPHSHGGLRGAGHHGVRPAFPGSLVGRGPCRSGYDRAPSR